MGHSDVGKSAVRRLGRGRSAERREAARRRVAVWRGAAALGLALTAVAATAEVRVRPIPPRHGAASAARPQPRTAAPGSRLLLPFYEVEAGNPFGASTLFAVRNESLEAVDVTLRYFGVTRPQTPQRTEQATLAPKQVKTVQIRDVPGLSIDPDGFARGYLEIAADAEEAVLEGDYFQVTAGEGFAVGDRLLNIDPASPHDDLCRRFTARYLNGGGFTAGTRFKVWIESEVPLDFSAPVLFYSVYDEAGQLRFSWELYSDEVAFTVDAATLLDVPPSVSPPAFGAIEFELNQLRGHVSAVMSASGLYSVGFSGACNED